jgi:hypothetical protein
MSPVAKMAMAIPSFLVFLWLSDMQSERLHSVLVSLA